MLRFVRVIPGVLLPRRDGYAGKPPGQNVAPTPKAQHWTFPISNCALGHRSCLAISNTVEVPELFRAGVAIWNSGLKAVSSCLARDSLLGDILKLGGVQPGFVAIENQPAPSSSDFSWQRLQAQTQADVHFLRWALRFAASAPSLQRKVPLKPDD